MRIERLSHFRGRVVTIKEVVDHVVAQTPYVSSHVKSLTLAPMHPDGFIASPNQRRTNTSPDGTLMEFAA